MKAYLKLIPLVCLVIFPLYPCNCTILLPESDSIMNNHNYPNRVLGEYISYSPIDIKGNLDFSVKANDLGWDGSGSEETPYLITNVNITDYSISTLVKIVDTDVYFIISESLFVGGLDSIRFENVTNGRISNNTIYHATTVGIFLSGCINCTLDLNYITDNNNMGLLIDYSENCIISNNTIENNSDDGAKLRDSSNNIIVGNAINNNRESGLVLGSSPNCDIIGNIIHDNWGRGISIEMSTPTQIINNSIYENSEEGVSIYGSETMSNVSGNTFYRNGLLGLRVFANQTQVFRNNFIDNYLVYDEIAHASDSSTTSVYSENYWNDWVYPDSNHDNVVDVPYNHHASLANSDERPQVYAYPDYKVHILTRPIPIFPDESLKLGYYFGMMNVIWGPSSDTFSHNVSYSLEYSTNETTAWTQIVSDLINTNYQWNTTSFSQNMTYVLKVVAECKDETIESNFDSNFTVREHTLSLPIILYPNGGEIATNRIEIQWLESIDSWNHWVSYNIYYSGDGGTTWIVIFEDIGPDRRFWELDSVPDGSYLIKVMAISSCGLTTEDTSDSEFSTLFILDRLRWIVPSVSIIAISLAILALVLKRRKAHSL